MTMLARGVLEYLASPMSCLASHVSLLIVKAFFSFLFNKTSQKSIAIARLDGACFISTIIHKFEAKLPPRVDPRSPVGTSVEAVLINCTLPCRHRDRRPGCLVRTFRTRVWQWELSPNKLWAAEANTGAVQVWVQGALPNPPPSPWP